MRNPIATGGAAGVFLLMLGISMLLLRRQRTVAERALLFMALCVAWIWATVYVGHRLRLLAGESALAWIAALLVIAVWQLNTRAGNKSQS